jgi:hypothetical protein
MEKELKRADNIEKKGLPEEAARKIFFKNY